MGIISTEVEVGLASPNIKYYEDLGYEIPRVPKKGNPSKMVVKHGTKIKVKVEHLPPKNAIYLDAECDCCGKKYKITNNNFAKVNHNGLIYCNKCAKKLFNSGANHPLFNPNRTPEDRNRYRHGIEYENFIKRVLARDNYTCQCCGKHRDELDCFINVHHIDSYDWCKEKRTDDSNGVTLCENCHINFHNKYGRGNNTKEQFDEWLGRSLEILKYDGEILKARKIFCYEENKVYLSANEFCRNKNIKSTSSVYNTCNHNNQYTIKGYHLFWYDDYVNMMQEEIDKYLFHKPIRNRIPIICLDTSKIYESACAACKATGINEETIRHCCKYSKSKYILLKDGTKQQWMYYSEYLALQKNNSNKDNIEHAITEAA